jgi:hypothetical protein
VAVACTVLFENLKRQVSRSVPKQLKAGAFTEGNEGNKEQQNSSFPLLASVETHFMSCFERFGSGTLGHWHPIVN